MWDWVRRLMSRRRMEAEMRAEMEFHRLARASDLVARGMAAEEAERHARLEFGGLPRYEEECRSALGFRLLDELRSDVRYAWRGLRRSPGFSATAVAILGLAIGANCVLFTLFSNYALKQLPVRGAERHFDVEGRNARARGTGSWTFAEIRTLRQNCARQVEGLYGSGTFQVLALQPVQRHAFVNSVTGNYFGLLGGVARLGRVFTEAEEAQPVVVLSDAGWRKLLGGDPAAVGRSLRIRSVVYTVLGVMGPEFTGTEAAVSDFWAPSGMRVALRDGEGEPSFDISGLLQPGVALGEAQAAMTAVASRLPREEARRVAVAELREHRSYLPDNEDLTAAVGMVFAAFLMVLLIACANLANLYLGRAASRTHEIAMRLSLGASRSRIVRQLLTESTLIALVGAAAGLTLASVGIRQVEGYLLSSVMGAGLSVLTVSLDWRVFLYTAGLGLLAGVSFGLLPALESTSPSLTSSAKREFSSFAGRVRPRRMRNLLIGGQVAASLVLLILAGLLIRNIQRLDSVEPGFDLDRVLDVRVDRPSRTLLEALGRLQSVQSISGVSRVPLYGWLGMESARVDGTVTAVASNFVDERYFETLGLVLLQGRGFTRLESDSAAKVAVISAGTAHRLWPRTGSALGRTIELVESQSVYEVIGVVPDVVSGFLFQGKDATAMYVPGTVGSPAIRSAIVRVLGNTAVATAAIRRACAEAGDGSAGCEPLALREVAAMQRFPFQAAAVVAGGLGLLALVLTAIGLYGVVNFLVLQRRREIGVHLALGATPVQMVGRILSEAWWCVVGGILAGLPVCLALSKVAAASVIQVRTFDLGPYVGVPLFLAALSMAACLGPAVRAARMDPTRSLREE